MDDEKRNSPLKNFRVDVGHSSVTVRCRRAEQAIPEARRKLAMEVPRLWDLIQKLEDERFKVVPLDENGGTE